MTKDKNTSFGILICFYQLESLKTSQNNINQQHAMLKQTAMSFFQLVTMLSKRFNHSVKFCKISKIC
jgi:hypothetical protein